MHELKSVIEIDFTHRDESGKPSATLENVEAIVSAFDIVIARPPLNAETFAPFFGPNRCPAAAPENVRDVHLSKLHDICQRHGVSIDIRSLTRHVQLIGLETEDAERRDHNAEKLRKGGVREQEAPW